MIKDLHENEFGCMEGIFYSDILGYDVKVMYKKNISQEYVEKNIQYLNNLKGEFLEIMCTAVKRYYESYKIMYPDLCEDLPEDILDDFEKDPESILQYIDIGVCHFDECDKKDEDVPVINIGGDCAWSGDEGITIAAKDNHLVYVGPWEKLNVWINGMDSGANRMFNYAIPKDV